MYVVFCHEGNEVDSLTLGKALGDAQQLFFHRKTSNVSVLDSIHPVLYLLPEQDGVWTIVEEVDQRIHSLTERAFI